MVLFKIFLTKKKLKFLAYGTALILSVYSSSNSKLYAQAKFSDNLNVMVNLHKGYNLPEYQFLTTITEDYVRSIDISVFNETTGESEWEQLYNYPEYGLSLFYSTLGNDKIMGREYALTYFFRVYLLSKNRFRIYNRIGIGLNYVTRKFELKDNYLNVAVGSNYNMHFNLRIGANYSLTNKIKLNTGISFDHFSNGNTGEPNLGINYLTGYGGISYRLGKNNERKVHELKPHVKNNAIEIFASVGGKHSRALASKFFFVSSFSMEIDRALSRKFSFGIGTDLFYDSSVETSLEKSGRNYKSSNNFQTGIHLAQSLRYNKFSISIQEGIYILLTEKVEKSLIYNRGIIKYQATEHLSVRVAMKSHLHILDYPEIGLGYKF